MSASDPHPADRRGRRIRIALDPAYGGAPALALAADLGRALQARIEAVFLESEDLLALARLPLAREITAATRLPRVTSVAPWLGRCSGAQTSQRLCPGSLAFFIMCRQEPSSLSVRKMVNAGCSHSLSFDGSNISWPFMSLGLSKSQPLTT